MQDRKSPCEHCTKVSDPIECTYKNCPAWNAWFLARWKEFNNYLDKYFSKESNG